MKKKSSKTGIDWSQEIVKAISLVGKIFLRGLGYLLNILLTLMLIGLITGTIVGGAFALYVTSYVDASIDGLELIQNDKNMTTKICYMDFTDRSNGVGKVVEIEDQRLYGDENRIWINYEDIPQDMIDAIVSIEDHRFWKHHGVDWITTIQRAFDYFTGHMDGGASTITQQLIKNVTGDNEVTIQRKAQEILRALNLEKELDKTQILELYLNEVYFGRGCYGIGAAAYTYFGKEVKDLTIPECASIVGITQNPSQYDPVTHPEDNIDRRKTVLLTMYNNNKISKAEYYEYIATPLNLNYQSPSSTAQSNVNSWYTDAAIEDAITLIMDHYGVTYRVAESMIYTSGFQIVTAQDPQIQSILEDYFLDQSHFPAVDESFIQPECSCVIVDPNTGDVLGLVGRRGEKLGNRILNYATQTKRPPGSSIKPISIYGPALEAGLITYGSVIDDTPVNFGDVTYDEITGNPIYSRPGGYPNNLPNVYGGLTTIHSAIRRSVNTVAYKVLEKLTPEYSYQFLTEKLGISTLVYSDDLGEGRVITDVSYAPLALGQLSYGLTVKELTAAYSIFANSGVYNKPRIVLQILDSEGKVIIDNAVESSIVISEQNASIMTKMLQEVVDYGTASRLTVKDAIDVAGKTGTTTSDNDRWFIGYTPYQICGVWFGYSMPQSLGAFSATLSPALVVWDDIMNEITHLTISRETAAGRSLKNFELADGVVTATYCADSGKLITDACKADPRGSRAEIGYFTASTVPTEPCDCHVLVNYDKICGGIATDACPPENIVQVGLIRAARTFPLQVTVTDAQYVYSELPFGVLPGGGENEPFFITGIPDKVYVGISSGTAQYNHLCQVHVPAEPGVEDPDPFEGLEDLWPDEE